MHRPSLLVLDEPTVGLDPELRASFWDHFRGLAAEGETIAISSHTMDDAAHCHRLAFIQEGRVVARGTPTELRTATGAETSSLEDAFLFFVFRVGPKEHNGQDKHEDRSDKPVLHQRQSQDAPVPEDPSHLLVAHLG